MVGLPNKLSEQVPLRVSVKVVDSRHVSLAVQETVLIPLHAVVEDESLCWFVSISV